MAKWMDLAIPLPVDTVDPNVVRKLLAAVNDNAPPAEQIPSTIFNYHPGGRPISGVSPFTFGGGRVFHIYASGNEAVDLLGAEGYKIVKLLERAYGVPLNEKRNTGFYGVQVTPRLQDYRVPMMVLQQSLRQHKDLMALDQPGIQQFVADKIRQTLGRHFCRLDLPVGMEDPEVVLGDVTINGDIHPVEVKPGVYFLAAREVSFRANLNLHGVFHVGHLNSRGYGRVFTGRREDQGKGRGRAFQH